MRTMKKKSLKRKTVSTMSTMTAKDKMILKTIRKTTHQMKVNPKKSKRRRSRIR
jgi:hypothetical protein